MNGGTKRYTLMFLKILIGSILDAAGISFLLYQNGIIMGGVMGISMILNRLLTTPVGLVTIALNVPLFILAWKRIDRASSSARLWGCFELGHTRPVWAYSP